MLTLDSQRQYEEMEVNVTCGGIEIARTEARMEELRRRMTSSKAWGIESHLISPDDVKTLVPFIDESVILGGFHRSANTSCWRIYRQSLRSQAQSCS